MFRGKNAWKTCDQKPKQGFKTFDLVKKISFKVPTSDQWHYQLNGSQGMIIDALERRGYKFAMGKEWNQMVV